jgi:hypothetical protein
MAGKLPGRALDSNTSISVSNISFGSNLSINTSAISIGNSTVNTVLRSNSATFSGHLMPTANITYDLGNSSMRWRDLWLSGTTINLGGAVIQTDTDTGAVAIIPKPTNDTPNPMAVILSAMGGVTAAQSVNGVLGAPAIAAAARSNNAMAVPIDIATSSPSNGQMLVWSTSSNTFIPHSTIAALTVSGNLVVSGNVFFNGATTNVNSTNLVVEDKNIIIGDVATPSDITADGGGITLKGATDKTLNWIDATDAWTSSEDFNLVSGKSYEINGTVVVNSTSLGTGITGSSLTSVGTLTTLAAGNTTITGFANVSGNVYVGNSTVFWTANSTEIDVGTSTINTIAIAAGANVVANTTALRVGNSTVNSVVTSTSLAIGSNTATFGTALYVVANGNVGINTASPAQLLDVNGNAIIRGIQGFNATNETATLFLGDGASYIQAVYDGGLDFYQNSTFRMRIQGGTGNVGIGNTAPTAKLQVDGTIKDSIGSVRTIQRTGSAKTSSYTLTTSDVGQFVEVGAGGSIVVPNSTFATGDVVSVFNNTSGNVTVTLNTTNAYIGGVDVNRTSVTLATRGIITILFLSGTLCIINGNVS